LLLQPRLAGLRKHRGAIVTGETDETDDDGKPIRKPIPLADGLTNDGEPVAVEPIIPPELWREVVDILTDSRRSEQTRSPLVAGKGGVARHLLAGMVFCGVCGAKCRITKHVGLRVYRCPPRAEGGRRCVQRDADKLENLIIGALFAAAEDPEWRELAAEKPSPGNDLTRELYERQARDQARLDKLDDELTLAEIDGDKRKAASIQRVQADVEARMDRTQGALARRQGNRVAAEIPRNLQEVWPGLSLDRRRAILATLLKLPPEGTGIQVFPQGSGRHVFDPETIVPDWRP
jgi:hypothetical protein